MTDDRTHSEDVLPDEEMLEADKDLTPPHGDELRSEVTFGRTDRYANADNEEAGPEQPVQDPEESRDTRRKR